MFCFYLLANIFKGNCITVFMWKCWTRCLTRALYHLLFFHLSFSSGWKAEKACWAARNRLLEINSYPFSSKHNCVISLNKNVTTLHHIGLSLSVTTVMRCCSLCISITGEDRWPVSAPVAEGAQSRASERTMDKGGGSKGKTSSESLFCAETLVTKWVNDMAERGESSLDRLKTHNTKTSATICNVPFSFRITRLCTCACLLPAKKVFFFFFF